jgi:S-formylglutathione hydrolase
VALTRDSRDWATRRLVFVALLAAAIAAPAAAQNGATPRKGTVERIKVHGAALEGNLEKDSPDREVFVYLPPSYGTSPTQRFPVVYLLHGYGLTGERWMSFTNVAAAADKNIAAGTTREMILVNPDAYTVYAGSMYSASPTTGDWEAFIADDLVSYVDTHYRTIPDRLSRGLGGHSMGGYGAFRIGMKRPDVFAALYPMSACCLIDASITGSGRGRGAAGAGNAAAAPAGRAGTNPAAASPTAAAPARQAEGNRGDAPARGAGAGARGGRGGGFSNVQSALAAAWAPNPKNPPQYFDQPIVDGVPQPLIVAKFAANSPFIMLSQYVTNLKKYKAIKIDVGNQDGLAASNHQMEEAMTAFSISHTFETYEGDHTNRVPQRIEESVLPFFSSNLSFAPPKK